MQAGYFYKFRWQLLLGGKGGSCRFRLDLREASVEINANESFYF